MDHDNRKTIRWRYTEWVHGTPADQVSFGMPNQEVGKSIISSGIIVVTFQVYVHACYLKGILFRLILSNKIKYKPRGCADTVVDIFATRCQIKGSRLEKESGVLEREWKCFHTDREAESVTIA